jgi:hypothetical protein
MNLLLFQKKRLSKGIRIALDFMGGKLDSRISFSRGSNATVVGSNGLIQYAPHNLLTYSEQFDNAAWNKNASIVITANANTAPDGTMTADEFSGSLVNCGVWRVPTTTASIPHIYSIYLKNVNNATNLLVGCDANPANAFIRFNSVTGEITSVAGNVTSSSVIAIGNGWYRVTVGFVPTTTLPTFVLYSTSGASATWLVWGAQLNEGALQPYYTTTVKNLLGYSQNFENAAWTKSNSSIAASTVIGPFGFDGGQKLVENTVNASHSINEIAISSATVGSIYTFSVYIKAAERKYAYIGIGGSAFSSVPYITVDLQTGVTAIGNGFPTSYSAIAVGNGWWRVQIAGQTTTVGTVVPEIRTSIDGIWANRVYTGDGTSGIYIFGAQLSDSASLDPYSYNPVAAPTSIAYYGPRFDYDPVTLAPKGLLIEEQRTNLALASSTFSNSTGTLLGGTAISPDNTNSANLIYEDTSSGEHYAQDRTISVTSGSSYTWSFFTKQGVGTRNAMARVAGAASASIYFNFQSETITVSGLINLTNYGSQKLNNGWYRLYITFTAASTGTLICRAQIVTSTSIYTGDGNSGIYLWGAQLEAGAFSTSYIPTTSATVTRVADNASMVGSNFSSWYNQSAGTVYCASDSPLTTTTAQMNWYINDGNTNNTMFNRKNPSNLNATAVVSGGVTQGDITSFSTITAYSTVKSAFAYKLNDLAISVNGASVGTDLAATIPTVDKIHLGQNVSNGQILNGHIQSIKYYPTRLPNVDLQRLTR